MIKIKSKVIIKSNLCEELKRLGFDDSCIDGMSKIIGKKYTVHDIWEDNESNQKYATVDLCVEIPLQCLDEIE